MYVRSTYPQLLSCDLLNILYVSKIKECKLQETTKKKKKKNNTDKDNLNLFNNYM